MSPTPNERAVNVVALALHDAACFMHDHCRDRDRHALLHTMKARALLVEIDVAQGET